MLILYLFQQGTDEEADDDEANAEQLSDEDYAKIAKQAEFYLSEDYLMKNAYLLRQVQAGQL